MQFTRQELLAIIRSVAYVATSDDEVADSENYYIGDLVQRGFHADVSFINEGMSMSQFQTFQILRNMSEDKKQEVLKMWIGMMKADGKIRKEEIDTIKFMCNEMGLFGVDIESLAYQFAQNGNGKFQRLAKPINLGGTDWVSTDGKLRISFDDFSVNGSQYDGEFAIYQYNSTTKKLTFDIIDYEALIGFKHEYDVLSLTSDTMILKGRNGQITLKKQA